MSVHIEKSEEWRPVVGWEKYYEVSSQGRVRSLDRLAPIGNGLAMRPGRVLQMPEDRKGYPQVHLHAEGIGRTRRIHTLVSAAFIGPLIPGMVIRHLDGNPANNHVANLAHGTPLENSHDAIVNNPDAPISRRHCPLGHLKEGDNLRLIHPVPGGRRRICRACEASHRWVQYRRRRGLRRPTPAERKAYADAWYARTMGVAA